MSTVEPRSAPERAASTFSRVLVGIDGSRESLEAARQAAVLATPAGELTLVAAWELAPPLVTPLTTIPPLAGGEREARLAAHDALAAARETLPAAATELVRGAPAHVLLDEIERTEATLVAVGVHGQGRIAGIVVGSTATRLIHDAPCSVLVARPTPERTPRRIAVGVDGSTQSATAYAVARYLAGRFDADLVAVVAEGGKPVDLAAVSLVVGDGFHVISAEPVDVLAAASVDADLLVVGSRGLHGFKALGSVSERVAHLAACSTLVVRERGAAV